MARMKLRKMGGEEHPLLLALARSLEEDTTASGMVTTELILSDTSQTRFFLFGVVGAFE